MSDRFIATVVLTPCLIAVCTVSSLSQVKPGTAPAPTLAPAASWIQLPEGYRFESRRGIDSSVGAFIRSDGFTIGHDIGRMAANFAFEYFPENFERLRGQTHLNCESIERDVQLLQNKIEWRQRQKVNGDDVMVVMLKDSTLIASFVRSTANFVAKADTKDKVAEFFLLVLTYQPNFPKR